VKDSSQSGGIAGQLSTTNPFDEGATARIADSEDQEVPGPKDTDESRAHGAVG